MTQPTRTETMNAEVASAFAVKAGLSIMSDMFGKHFVVQAEGQQLYRVAFVNKMNRHQAIIGQKEYATIEEATQDAKTLSGVDVPTELVASLPDNLVVASYCRQHGFKASDDSHAGYMTISKPIQDRQRKWHAAKRVGTTLKIIGEPLADRWGANGKVRELGGPEVTEALTGPFIFPYGNHHHNVRALSAPRADEDERAA